MYEFEQLTHDHAEKWGDIEVIVDSPLASRFTAVYKELKPYWDEEAQEVIQKNRYPLTFKQLSTIESHKDHQKTVKYLAKSARPTIVIAASGMCNGGRIMSYLKALIEDKRTDILFTGYQARNSIGRKIQNYGPSNGYVKIDGQSYTINAQIHRIGGYSAHADQQDLIDFASGMDESPDEIRVVHGDESIVSHSRIQVLHPEIGGKCINNLSILPNQPPQFH